MNDYYTNENETEWNKNVTNGSDETILNILV